MRNRTDVHGTPTAPEAQCGGRGPWGGRTAGDAHLAQLFPASEQEPQRVRPEGTERGSPGSVCIRLGRPWWKSGSPGLLAFRRLCGGWAGSTGHLLWDLLSLLTVSLFFFPLIQ